MTLHFFHDKESPNYTISLSVLINKNINNILKNQALTKNNSMYTFQMTDIEVTESKGGKGRQSNRIYQTKERKTKIPVFINTN